MNKYRIIEKKGSYICVEEEFYKTVFRCSAVFCDETCIKHPYVVETPAFRHQIYRPRFIVQEDVGDGHGNPGYSDLKEFNNLEDARQYKRDLELDKGIVIE